MRVLSVRQPWARAIFELGKDIENRKWSTLYRGPLVIHVAKIFDRSALYSNEYTHGLLGASVSPETHTLGSIIGLVHLVDIVTDAQSAWARAGHFHWKLAGAFLFDSPMTLRGRQGLWEPDLDVRTHVSKSSDAAQKKWRNNQPV